MSLFPKKVEYPFKETTFCEYVQYVSCALMFVSTLCLFLYTAGWS